MAGTTATRLWRVSKQAGRSFPILDDDEVIDFMIAEAIAIKVDKEDSDAAKKQEREEWKRESSGLEKLKELAG